MLVQYFEGAEECDSQTVPETAGAGRGGAANLRMEPWEPLRIKAIGQERQEPEHFGPSLEFVLDIMYEIPKDDNIGSVTITKAYIEGKGSPMIAMRGTPALPESPSANN